MASARPTARRVRAWRGLSSLLRRHSWRRFEPRQTVTRIHKCRDDSRHGRLDSLRHVSSCRARLPEQARREIRGVVPPITPHVPFFGLNELVVYMAFIKQLAEVLDGIEQRVRL